MTVEVNRYRELDYNLKGLALEKAIKEQHAIAAAHVHIPMDCDEFLCLDQSDGIIANRRPYSATFRT